MGAIGAWLGEKALFGVARGWLIAGAVAVLLALGGAIWAEYTYRKHVHDAQQQTIGAQGVVIAGQTQTLNQLKDAKNAEQTLKTDNGRSAERYRQCLLDSRRPSACDRYKPNSAGK